MRLKTAYNEHPAFTKTVMDIESFNKTAPAVKEIALTHQSTGVVAVVDFNKNLTMACCVCYKKDTDGNPTSILVNTSVLELKPASVGVAMTTSFPFVCPAEEMPGIAISGAKLTRDQMAGTSLSGNVKMGTMSRVMILPHGKTVIEGYAIDKLDEFETVYGREAGEWLRAVLHASRDFVTMCELFNRVNETQLLEVHLGLDAAKVLITLDHPCVCFSNVNEDTNPEIEAGTQQNHHVSSLVFEDKLNT